jgi:hypothetical protein
MVRGLDQFKKHFAAYASQYVLIGGTACSLAMEEAGLMFRATKDLDIVLWVEALESQFVRAFWDFIRAGKYKNRHKSTGRRLFYRFNDPEDETYPVMLELFSRMPDALILYEGSHLTPIPVDEEASSLSAILLDDDYYYFIQAGKREIDGLPVVGAEHLVPLKARAWLDMLERQEKGELIDSKNIRKHKNDVARLYQLLAPATRIGLPESVKQDLKKFLDLVQRGEPFDLKSVGLKNTTLNEVIRNLRLIYGLDS